MAKNGLRTAGEVPEVKGQHRAAKAGAERLPSVPVAVKEVQNGAVAKEEHRAVAKEENGAVAKEAKVKGVQKKIVEKKSRYGEKLWRVEG